MAVPQELFQHLNQHPLPTWKNDVKVLMQNKQSGGICQSTSSLRRSNESIRRSLEIYISKELVYFNDPEVCRLSPDPVLNEGIIIKCITIIA